MEKLVSVGEEQDALTAGDGHGVDGVLGVDLEVKGRGEGTGGREGEGRERD